MPRPSFILAAFLQLVPCAFAYGPLGHEIVGAIADRKLAGTETAAKVSALLDGMTLQRASTIADEIRAWDKRGADDLSAYPHYPKWPRLENQLRDFWRANQPGPNASDIAPSHHWFHYTDVPVLDVERYGDGKTGRGNWDIVHTIPYCIGVLRGEIAENNPRNITRPIALILLAHLVGDIHQPLHVGAEYFTAAGQPVDPDHGAASIGDEGGNSLSFVENATAEHPRHYYHSFHSFWDFDTVRNLVIGTPDEPSRENRAAIYSASTEKLLTDFAAREPANRHAAGDPRTWAEQWANEILPVAREAHARVRFEHMHAREEDGRIVVRGEAREISSGYREWSSGIVRRQLHLAGWRLADLLKAIL